MKRISSIFLLCLLASGCDKWFPTSENVKSCTKIYLRPFGIRINGLPEKELSQITLKIKDEGGEIRYSRSHNLFSPETSGAGLFKVEGFYGTQSIFKETMKVERDSQGCHAIPVGRAYDCQEVSGSVRCSLIDATDK